MDINPEAVRSGFELLKGAIETLKNIREVFRSKPQAEAEAEIAEKIKLAEREVALAEAQIAQGLGYKICRAHFPPIAMLKIGVHPKYLDDISKCPVCGMQEPSPESFASRERIDRSVDEYNRRLTRDNDWMSR